MQSHYNVTQLSVQKLEEIIKYSNFILTAEDFQNHQNNGNNEEFRMRAHIANSQYLNSEMGIDLGYVMNDDVIIHYVP